MAPPRDDPSTAQLQAELDRSLQKLAEGIAQDADGEADLIQRFAAETRELAAQLGRADVVSTIDGIVQRLREVDESHGNTKDQLWAAQRKAQDVLRRASRPEGDA